MIFPFLSLCVSSFILMFLNQGLLLYISSLFILFF